MLRFSKVGIAGISVTVPRTVKRTMEQSVTFTREELEKFMKATGIEERRIAPEDICASDLCYDAAVRLLNDSDIPNNKIDVLIFVSQTPDYRVPGTSILLQHRLALPQSVLAFDVNMTCSGYLYGLYIAYSLMANEKINNVLLLLGETMSKLISDKDKATSLLLGDAGSATLLTKGEEYSDSYFSLQTDGSNFDAIHIPMGGFRRRSSPDSLAYVKYEDGSERNGEQVYMDGMSVFSFAISELPKNIKCLLGECGVCLEEIDKFIFHQANKLMTDFVAKKLRVDKNKVLSCIRKFGNTSGVSIPLTMVYEKDRLQPGDTLLLNAIGAGFSWGTLIMKFPKNCILSEINEL